MALMFRSVLQNSGGAAELIVTCASQFAGETISCSDSTTTLTKTCPSSSPYTVTFKIPNSGNWTISATVGGVTYTSDPITVELDYTAELSYGFNWKVWVDTSRYLDSSDYSTLADLLADEEAVRELCTEHATVDYMAGAPTVNADLATVINDNYFAKWVNLRDYALDTLYANEEIADEMDEADKYFYGEWVITDSTTTPVTWGPKGNVPVMTSNSAPYGEAGATATYSSTYAAYHAFDGVTGTGQISWSAGSTANAILYYKFTNPICPRKFAMMPEQSQSGYDVSTKTWDIVATNNISDGWTTLYSGENENNNNVVTDSIENSNYYLYVGIRVKTSYRPTQSYSVNMLQFYGRELSVSVPAMTSNTTPYGEVTASSYYSSGTEPYKAFDNTSGSSFSDYWRPNTSDGWVKYEFTSATEIKGFSISYMAASTGLAYSAKCIIQASEDDDTWTDISPEFSVSSASVVTIPFSEISQSVHAKFVRLLCTGTNTNLALGYVNVFGLDYSEKEFEVGATKKWLYDHGLELEELYDYLTANTSGYITKESSYIEYGRTTRSTASPRMVAIENNNAIDLTDYSLLRASVDKIFSMSTSSSGTIMTAGVMSAKGTSGSLVSSVSLNPGSTALPHNIGLDISAVNGDKYIYFGTEIDIAFSASLNEIWLE